MIFALLYWCSLSQRLTVRCPPPSDWWGVLSDSRTVSTVRVVLTLGLPCLLIYLSLGYAWRVFAFVFLLLFYFFPSPPIRSGEVFSSVIFFLSFSSFVCVFLDVAMVWKGKPASVTTGTRDRTYVRK